MSAQLRVCHTTAKDPPTKYLQKVKRGITAAATKWGVNLDPKLEAQLSSGKYKCEGKKSTRFGNRPIEENTKSNYENSFRQLWRFCVVKGDYESLLTLLSPRPQNTPSVNVKSLDEFLRFKRQTAGIDLLTFDGGAICKDVFENLMTVSGSWKAPKNVLNLSGGVHALHVACNHTAEYQEPCEDCRALPQGNRHKGCLHHNDRPLLYRKGDPTSHIIYLNSKKQLLKDDIAYEEKGSIQLLPSDLRLLGRRLLSTKSIVDLQTWVIIIVATLLFLRHDEFHDIELKQFLPNLFEIFEDRVSALALKVFGKSDKRWLQRKLIADKKFPEFCPVSPLLIYTHLIRIKGGFLFPDVNELDNPPADGIYKTTVNYSNFLRHIQKLCEDVLPARENMQIGCQTFRKTGYLFAIFGDANSIDLQTCARHATDKNRAKYRKDAAGFYRQHKEHPNPANSVGKWAPVHIENSGNSRLMAAYSGHIYVEFNALGDYYVRQILGIKANNAMARDPIFLVRLARENARSDCQPIELLRKFKDRCLNADQADELQLILDNYMRERLQTLLGDENTTRSLAFLPVATATTVTPPLVRRREGESVPVSPARKKAKNDLPERSKIKDCNTTRTKINIMKGLWDQKASWEQPLTPGANSFRKKFLNPTMLCLEKHFAGSVDAFVEAYPDYEHTKFAADCDGKGNSCTPKKK